MAVPVKGAEAIFTALFKSFAGLPILQSKPTSTLRASWRRNSRSGAVATSASRNEWSQHSTGSDRGIDVEEMDVAPSVDLLESMRSVGTPSKPQWQTSSTTASPPAPDA
jgi:hypothetical protein